MNSLSPGPPESLHRNLKHMAEAVGENPSIFQGNTIFAERAKGASRESFLQAMRIVPKGAIEEGDEPQHIQ
jgi:hypothetical protein